MVPKRKPGDGVEESLDEFAKPLDDTTDSSSDFAKPVYLVAAREDDQAAYSVLKLDATAVAGGDERPRIHTIAGLPRAEPGMSFVAAHSKHGSWMVGVGGGLRAGTVIFDPRTLKTFQGPRLAYPKHKPVLISHGGESNVRYTTSDPNCSARPCQDHATRRPQFDGVASPLLKRPRLYHQRPVGLIRCRPASLPSSLSWPFFSL
ncbi:unnamed protein product [Urochloa humidicola]